LLYNYFMNYRKARFGLLLAGMLFAATTAVAAPGCFIRTIGCNSKVFETLNASSCSNASGNRIDVYRFTWINGYYVTMTQKSSAFVPWVAIGDGAQNVLDFDREPRNDTSQLTFRLPYSGEYFIYAGTFAPFESGAYSIEVRCSLDPPPPPCSPPAVLIDPVSQRVPRGTRAELTITATGTSLAYSWYRGARGDTSHIMPFVISDRMQTDPILSAERFWVRVKNGCGSVDSLEAVVTPMSSRRRVVRH
jgi:hypothetical protein